MTFFVPISAAMLNGISSSNHGVLTMRGCSFSMYPSDPGTMYPTQSIMRTRRFVPAPSVISAACSGMNFGSVVMIVRPDADCGSSSVARSLRFASRMFGKTSVSIKRPMNVDLPVRTGPTTPM